MALRTSWRDIDGIKGKMLCQVEEAEKSLRTYNVHRYDVMSRKDKIIKKKDDNDTNLE